MTFLSKLFPTFLSDQLSAVITGSLSRRWRGLWKNTTSIDISSRTSDEVRNSKLFYFLPNIVMQIRSPIIHSFLLEVDGCMADWQNNDYSWLLQICQRNIRELKLILPYYWGHSNPILPCYILQIRSLVSLELDLSFNWELPKDGDPIILPNLKKLSLIIQGSQLNCIEKLIKTCSLLEDLSLKFKDTDTRSNVIMNYWHQNLRRLSIKMDLYRKSKIVINAPKLHYLNLCGGFNTRFCFEEKPVALREAEIRLDGNGSICTEGKELMAKFHEAISNVRFLTLDNCVLGCISNVFSNATRVTIDMRSTYQILIPSLPEMYPALDVLIIKLGDVSRKFTWKLNLPEHGQLDLKRIEIEYFLPECQRPLKSFLSLLKYLFFSRTIASEHFHFRLTDDKYSKLGCVERKKIMELGSVWQN